MPVNRRLPHHLLLKYYYFNKNISSLSLSSWSLSPSLSSHFFLFSSFSLILTFSFSLPFLSTATTLKATVATISFSFILHERLCFTLHWLAFNESLKSLSKSNQKPKPNLRDRIGVREIKKRERSLFPATHHALSTSIPSPQPICYHGPCATTIGPPYNPAKTHATKPTTLMPPLPRPGHQHSVATIARDWQREP